MSGYLKADRRAFGVAGLKDVQALTRQWISVHNVEEKSFAQFSHPALRILSIQRHANKLRVGHLAGNRFRVRIVGVDSQADARARAVMEHLGHRGVPNFFGSQRFGLLGTNAQAGKALLLGRPQDAVQILMDGLGAATDPRVRLALERHTQGDWRGAWAAIPEWFGTERIALQLEGQKRADQLADRLPIPLLRLLLESYPSQLFNRYLSLRLDRIDRLEYGEIAVKHANGAAFRVEDPLRENERARAFEISPSGPLFGPKLLRPAGEPFQMEERILSEEGMRLEDFSRAVNRQDLKGIRRPLRVPLSDWAVETEGPDALWVSFTLPAGAYATVVLNEIVKSE